MISLKRLALILVAIVCFLPGLSAAERPNVLFIAVDDLNHWVGYTGRNPQVKTPNIDRLSKMGVSFTNAHCAAPACGPSRASLFSGMRPSSTGCYLNADQWRKYIPKGVCLNHTFKQAGYWTVAMGKTYHTSAGGGKTVYADEWHEYPPLRKPGSSTGGASKYQGFHEPMPLDMQDEDLADWQTVDYCIEQMNAERDQPFFVACGLIKPHLPWAVPRKYYELYPRDQIQLPPHRADDLDDLPPAGVRMAGANGDHAKFLKSGRWKDAIQSYQATIAYVDKNIGRLLDGLENNPARDNTIVVLWGDHGWHLGEKQHWRKFTLWEEATRVPLIIAAPGVTKANTLCKRPVDLMSLYPTLCDLSGIDIPKHVEGKSIRQLLEQPNAKWDGVAVTTHGYKNHTVRDQRWRYIRYANGDEELYDHGADPYEFDNVADKLEHADVKTRLASHLPTNDKPAKKKPSKKQKSASKK